MSNSTQFRVSMLFTGTDQLSPTTRKMIESMKSVQRQAQSMLSGGGMKAPKMFDDMSRALKSLSNQIDDIKKKMKDMQSEGFHDLVTGGAAIAPIIGMAKQAGEIQMQQFQFSGVYNLEMASDKLKEIKQQAQELSGKTLFSQKEIQGMGLELAHAQISQDSLKNVLPEATYVAEMEVLANKTSSPERSAYNFARMAEDARITNDPDKLSKFADSLFRVVNVTHASSESLGETFKYAMPVVKNLGWDENDMLNASALAAVNGMEGSMAGTHIKDFAERINPYKFLDTKGGQKQLDAMNKAGLLDGVKYDSNGKIIGLEGAALLKNKDSLKSYSDMVSVLTEKHKDFIKAGKSELEWAATMNHIFGEQGQDFAIISSHKEMYDKVNASKSNQKGLHENITGAREQFLGEMHALHSKIQGLTLAIGEELLPEVTKLAKEAQPYITGITEMIRTHKDVVVTGGKVVGAFGVFMLALGATKLAVGTVGSLLLGPIKTGLSTFGDLLGTFGTKNTLNKTLPEKAIQANVVNVYGKAINGGVGGGVTLDGGGKTGKGGKGKPVVPGELPPRSATHGGGSISGGTIGKTVSWGKGVLKRGGALAIPATLAFGAWDVMTAPEGKKVETAVKTSGTVIGGWAGAEAGMAMGAAIGSVVPGIGTAIGGVLGGIIGGVAGSYLGDSLSTAAMDALNKAKLQAAAEFSNKDKYPSLNVFPKLDTSKYTTKEQAATAALQKNTTNYYDTSTQHFTVQANNPQELLDQIKDSKKTFSNLSKRELQMANSE